ncbi:MAG TPA: hypothetical protein DCY35_07130, partial [Prolixibacteraceae bacterium]|nr:hypothetical protein [Prolixibacteraceae bacterium]
MKNSLLFRFRVKFLLITSIDNLIKIYKMNYLYGKNYLALLMIAFSLQSIAGDGWRTSTVTAKLMLQTVASRQDQRTRIL